MELRTLTTFKAAAHTLSFTKAAVSLGYAQSSVTTHMKLLEETLGAQLFNRLGNRLELTEPGVRFLGYAERILALTEEAKSSLQERVGVGTVRFTAPETICSYLLPAVMKSFKVKYPQVRLQFLPGAMRDYKRQVLDGDLDLAFILEEPFPSRALAMEKLRDEQVLVLAAPSHPLATAPGVHPQDLAGEAVLLTELGCSYRNQFERQLIAAGAFPSDRQEFHSIETIKRCVEAGLGIAPLPGVAVRAELLSGSLVALRWTGPDIRVGTHLIWNPQKQQGSAEKLFRQHVLSTIDRSS